MAVFSVFNIGTGHTQKEPNNTMKILYDDCREPKSHKYVNDGPTGGSAITGWGMNTMLENTMAAIKTAQPDRVNLAGHSRGAVLCHMLAHAIYADPETRHMEITLTLIDPVHMSKIPHEGAEGLDKNPKLLAYQAIIMENENTAFPLIGRKVYPFNFVTFQDKEEAKKIYYINMPGTHGSGTQVLTNPVGKVSKELIANFMRKRGSTFETRKKQPIEMCELFAEIHLANPLNRSRSKRWTFDDKGAAKAPDQENAKWQSLGGRAASINKAIQHNFEHPNLDFKRRNRIPRRDRVPYFINEKHAKFFSVAFPRLWSVINPWTFGARISRRDYEMEMELMSNRPLLGEISDMVTEMIPEGAIE